MVAVATTVGLLGCAERVIELAPRIVDASSCTADGTQCTNCLDDDGDGMIDGFDIECTGAIDDDEGSFETDIPGDNSDVTTVDCFFDGNSGAGDDDCDLHVCCVLAECPADLPGPMFDPSMCTPTATCIESCEPLVPPGCDCLGCCAICDDVSCENVYLSPALAPDCTAETLHDPVACPTCEPLLDCGQPCGGSTCILCPGQTADDLPASCTGATCPEGEDPCTSSLDCAGEQFCAAGCCIAAIP